MTGQIIAQARGGKTKSPPVKPARPRFSTAWQAYPVGTTTEQAYALVGGNAEALYKEGEARKKSTDAVIGMIPAESQDAVPTAVNPYGNACAIRLSRAFNYSGLEIKSGNVDSGYRVKGGDGKAYFVRVKHICEFIKKHLGEADLTISGGGDNAKKQLFDKKGILIFSITGWRDASGHATLWDGSGCGDSCYFEHNDSRVKTTQIEFWELKDD